MYTGILCFFTYVKLAHMITCRTLVQQPPWVRPEAMAEILFQAGNIPQIVRVLCPTDGTNANITWWRGSDMISEGEELRFRPLESSHIGKYHCQAKNKAGLSISRKLEVRNAFLEIKTPTRHRMLLLEGESTSLNCAGMKGYPLPIVFWNSTKSQRPPRFVVDPEGTLHLPDVALEDDGQVLECSVKHLTKNYVVKIIEITVYPRPRECFEEPRLMYATQNIVLEKSTDAFVHCVTSGSSPVTKWTLPTSVRAAVSGSSSNRLRINTSTLATNERAFQISCKSNGVEKKISVTLASAPIVLPMNNISKTEGERAVLRCQATGRPRPTIEWLFNGQPMDKSKIIRDEVYLPNVTMKDMGVYRCEAFNNFSRSHQELILSVFKVKPQIVADTECFELVVGESVSIPCVDKAFNQPKKRWYRNGTEIEGTSSEEHLELINVQLKDNGHYVCQVCEVQQNPRCSEYRFEVKVVTTKFLETFPKPLVVGENKPLNLRCIPRFPDDVIMWRVNGTYRNQGELFHSEKPQTGTYTCELHRNKALVNQWDGLVTVQQRPTKPKIYELTCSDRSATLRWTSCQDAAFYEIYHLHDSQRWRTVGFVVNNATLEVKLSRCSLCKFRVRSHNEVGSTISEVKGCQVLARTTDTAFVRKTIVTRKQDTMQVSWSPSVPGNHTCYRVCSHSPESCVEVNKTETLFKLNEDTIKSSFTVSQCGIASFGESTSSLMRAYYNCNITLEITGVRHLKAGSVEVFWNFDSDHFCKVEGCLTVDGFIKQTVDLTRRRHLLEGLKSNRIYCAELKAFHGTRNLQSASIATCFSAVQGWEKLEVKPVIEVRGSDIRAQLPENTVLFHSPRNERERWIIRNVSSMHFTNMGNALIKFVQKVDGYCRVSDVVSIREKAVLDWLVWLSGAIIAVAGVFSFVLVFFKKKSLLYSADSQ